MEVWSRKEYIIKLIGMLDYDYSGDYFIGKNNISNKGNRKRKEFNQNKYIGYIWQDYSLIDKFTGFNNIAIPMMLRNEKYEVINKSVKEIEKKLDIDKLLYKSVIELSGGERQRVSINVIGEQLDI